MTTPEPAPLKLGGVASLGHTARELRDRRRLTQAALGRAAGLHPDSLGALERGCGKNPSLGTVCRVAAGLGVSASVLTAAYVWPPGSAVPIARAEIDGTLAAPRPALGTAFVADPARAKATGALLTAMRRMAVSSIADVASSSGTSVRYVACLEHGEVPNPGLSTVVRIAAGLLAPEDRGYASLDVYVGRLARVFAGETTAAAAVRA